MSPAPGDDGLGALLELVESPAALCDLSLIVLACNPPMQALARRTPLLGRPLTTTLVRGTLPLPSDGRRLETKVDSHDGGSLTLTLMRQGERLAVMVQRLNPVMDSLAAAGRALLEQARIESQLLEVGQGVLQAGTEKEVVDAVARGVRQLFPGRLFAVRIVDPRSGALTWGHAEGRLLRPLGTEPFGFPSRLLEGLGRPAADQVASLQGELPVLFEGAVRALAAPLLAQGRFFGALHLEYLPGQAADLTADERALAQLGQQVALGIRNAKLIEELRMGRRFLEELLETAGALILVTDREGRVTLFNRALVELTGVPAAQALGQPAAALVRDSDRLTVEALFRDILTGAPGQTVELELRAEGREPRGVFSLSAYQGQSGQVDGLVAIGQDLTRVRELEQRVQRTEKLAQFGQLAASLAHEIKNPMTAVKTYAQALLQRGIKVGGDPDPDAHKYQKIAENAERVLRFTQDLMSYARPGEDVATRVDLAAVVRQAVGYCEHLFAAGRVEVAAELEEGVQVQGVPHKLTQVFVNLITNACQAMPEGGTLTVVARREDGLAVVEVSDQGPGIAAEVLPRIFDPFFTTRPSGGGTGLGLSIVQSQVERHGGTVEVESAPGKGSRFRVRLPLLVGVIPRDPAPG